MKSATAPPRLPNLDHECRLSERHPGPIAGVDEAGRGPWAGPVVAAAVIFRDRGQIPCGINDSKALSAAERSRLAKQIAASAYVGIGFVSPAVIDSINIRQATLLAMQDAIAALSIKPVAALIDGRDRPQLACHAVALIKGDSLSVSIAAASIIAKVTRDSLMQDFSRQYPGYGWERNMGYGTQEHARALRALGITEHHRRSFAPVREIMALR